ncbi:nuclear transport factor 2 family protein [Coraliomargarita algicola]|uniref:Nuclear transport factor 2 family protein n=1 Tax=Coraliomargarita algicola TaxID=3092156 RepID=A0ABZ0RET4_9BACT|nr:nuclear transport factor 2 family protein [Coraliomargarita sp. J2-16]WPJ94541.1 nuclear transport factor 2 family protein [Coraliomargarita sp. J2-16]
MHTQTTPNAAFQQALIATDPAQFNLPAPGSDEEAEMLKGIQNLFMDYSHANLSAKVEQVYAERVYFRDAFRQLHTAEEIREYFLEGLEPLEGAEFVFNNVARTGGDFYLDWTMRLDFKKTPTGTWEESMGVSRIRFDSAGQVIFHQDFWDPTDIVYQRIPIAKQLIAYVKGKL